MSIEFVQAPEVSAGDPIASRQLNALAEAWNSRIRSGIGDVAWRIAYYCMSLFRKVRNDDGSLSTPQDEWFKIYGHIDSRLNIEWPESAPGLNAGANLGSAMMAWVHGDGGAVDPEDIRTSMELGFSETITPTVAWSVGRKQRGHYTPETGQFLFARAWEAATEFLYFGPNHIAKHLVSYGGFFPTPASLGLCGDVDNTPKLRIKFTATDAGIAAGLGDRQYSGFCPSGSTGAGDSDAIQGYVRGPTGYYILRHDGDVDSLPYAYYVEGPYDGVGELGHGSHGGFKQVLNKYVLEFRGTPEDRAASGIRFDVATVGFPFEKILRRQWLLAPIWHGAPTARVTGTVGAGTVLASYTVPSGAAFSGWFVKCSNPTGTAAVQLKVGGDVVSAAELSSGTTDFIAFFDTAYSAGTTFTIETDDGFTADSLDVETCVQIAMKPGLGELYVLLRMISATSASLDQYDGDGRDQESPKDFATNYLTYGAVLNTGSAGLAPQIWPSNNGVYEAARRLVVDHHRMLDRNMVTGYALEDGKSVVWCKRYAFGLSRDADADMFRGMVDEIADTAPVNGYTNEWVMTPTFVHYRDTGTSNWDFDVHGDINGFHVNPCHVYSSEIGNNYGWRNHIAPGQGNPRTPNSPSAYNFMQGINDSFPLSWSTAKRENHFKSCKIHKPAYEVESVTPSGPDEVKIVFKTRFLAHESAPGILNRDSSGWDTTNLYTTQDYATDENRVMKWVKFQDAGTNAPLVTGDGSADGLDTMAGLADDPFGAIAPRLNFVKLVPKVYSDSNDRPDNSDTRFEADPFVTMDLYSRPLCEGFIDDAASLDSSRQLCTDAGAQLYDFTFENAALEATGQAWFEIIPTTLLPEATEGFTPLPRTRAYAETFNQYARFINLMIRSRLELPMQIETRADSVDNTTPINPVASNDLGTWDGVNTLGEYGVSSGLKSNGKWAIWDGAAPAGTATSGAWSVLGSGGSITAQAASGINATHAYEGSPNWRYAARYTSTVREWRIKPTHESYHALTPDLQELVEGGNWGAWGSYDEERTWHSYELTGAPPDCGGVAWPGDPVTLTEHQRITAAVCEFRNGGTVEPPALIPGADAIHVEGASGFTCTHGGSTTSASFVISNFANLGSGNIYLEPPVVDYEGD